jgi:hypothetical protein
MKNNSKWMRRASIIIVFFISAVVTNAQPFAPAVFAETAMGAATSGSNTGNDMKQIMGTTFLMSVHVWDGASPGLGWDDFAGNAGFLTFPSAVFDPDVTLTFNGATWWAIVAYFSPGAGYFADYYLWTGTAFIPGPSNLLTACANFGLSINIDGDILGDFVIAWDDQCTGNIQAIAGTTAFGGMPTLCTAAPIAVTGTNGCVYPDITLYTTSTSMAGQGVYSLVFLNTTMNRLIVVQDKFGFLCTALSIPTVVHMSVTSQISYFTPRIACPPPLMGVATDWSVVVTEIGPVGYDVLNFTNLATTIFNWNYTSGFPALFPSIIQWNKYPAISYDLAYQGIIVSWNCFYTGAPGAFTPPGPIAVQARLNGNLPTVFCPFPQYMIVSTTNLTSTAMQEAISVAGRDASRMLYTFSDNNFPDIMYKVVPFTSCNLRLRDDPITRGIHIYPNPVQNSFTVSSHLPEGEIMSLSLTDAMGREVIGFTGTLAEVNSQAEILSAQLQSGVYIMQISSAAGVSTLQMVKK